MVLSLDLVLWIVLTCKVAPAAGHKKILLHFIDWLCINSTKLIDTQPLHSALMPSASTQVTVNRSSSTLIIDHWSSNDISFVFGTWRDDIKAYHTWCFINIVFLHTFVYCFWDVRDQELAILFFYKYDIESHMPFEKKVGQFFRNDVFWALEDVFKLS